MGKYISKSKYEERGEEIVKEKLNEAKEQLKKYKKTEEIKMIPKLRSYAVVAIKDKLMIEEEKLKNEKR